MIICIIYLIHENYCQIDFARHASYFLDKCKMFQVKSSILQTSKAGIVAFLIAWWIIIQKLFCYLWHDLTNSSGRWISEKASCQGKCHTSLVCWKVSIYRAIARWKVSQGNSKKKNIKKKCSLLWYVLNAEPLIATQFNFFSQENT